jgi:hypothetical protein
MSIIEAARPEALELFHAVCEAADVPPGSRRFDIFLALPEPEQGRVWRDLVLLAKAEANGEAA